MGIRIMPYPSKKIPNNWVNIFYDGGYEYVCEVNVNNGDEKYIQEKEYRFVKSGLEYSNEDFYIRNNTPVVLKVHYYGELDSGSRDKTIQPGGRDGFNTSGEFKYDVGITPVTSVPEIVQGPLTYIKI